MKLLICGLSVAACVLLAAPDAGAKQEKRSARKAKAAADAQPFKDAARARSIEAETKRERLAELKKAKPRDEAAIAATDAEIAALVKEAREATAKAEAIENAVYDLKAVNPNRKTEVDARTPTDLIEIIEAKGTEVAAALASLRSLVGPEA